ncbi:erythromycin esterase family protein [Haloplanus sp. C73]|uniref:erythromycin esterase family protein n=1 Tax=Haloplanus sp. C73 TaxID=3421641 RepID=UPI003EB93632
MAHLDPRGRFQPDADVEPAVAAVDDYAQAVDRAGSLDPLIERLSDADCVLLGEASHGTSEYYRLRSRLSARLLRDHDFSFVAVEGDWTSCYAVNRYIKGYPDAPADTQAALESFDRWPTWMWANWEIESFVDWLRAANDERPVGDRVGFYGLDVYGLHESMRAVVDYLERVDPEAAERAREAYRCFEPYGEDAQEYARALKMVPESCREDVIEVLRELRENAPTYGERTPDDRFDAEQNALVARNAEAYYRSMVEGEEDSWNVRDRHMTDTLERLRDHHGPDAKGIVWAHNTHVGDARATDMPQHGRINIGQLARERDALGETYAVGFGSHRGDVVAGNSWGAQMQTMDVPPARSGSYEQVFHRADPEDALLFSADLPDDSALAEPRGHRAIGVVYHPDREAGNYVPTVLPERYDAFLHLDETRALHPLALHPDRDRVPELYPSGF